MVAGAGAEPRLVPVGIGYAVNRAHDVAPYYGGQVSSYNWLKPGVLRVEVTPGAGPVPFVVLDPAQNHGCSVVITQGAKNEFPAAIHVYPYQCGVRRVYLLGVAGGWASKPAGTEAGAIVFRFADGTEERQPLRFGGEVDDWTRHTATRARCVAAAGANGSGAHLDALAFDLMSGPDRMLTRLTLEDSDAEASLSLFAVTLAVEGDTPEAERNRQALVDLRQDLVGMAAGTEALRAAQRADEVPPSVTDSRRGAEALLARAAAATVAEIVPVRVELAEATELLAELARRRRFSKRPDESKPSFPDLDDYMLLLERFPLWAERGWHDRYRDDPELGYFGEGGHEELSLRPLGSFIFTYALLAGDPRYDASVSGVEREVLLARTRAALRYMTRTHVTGDLTCANGKRWGNHWQSAWWTVRLAAGARLIWPQLAATEQDGVRRVLVAEADRHVSRRPPGEEFGNTRSEENAWDSEVLAWAACLYPDHDHAKAWDEKAREFFMNTLSVASDKTDATLVDGKPVRDWVTTVNVHPDFTIENHGAYQFCYMACPLHSLTWAHYAYTSTGRPPPQALFHHFRDVWDVIRRTHLYQGRFAYLGGKDWPRYVYGLYFIMPPLVLLQNESGDQDARLFERLRFRTFEWEQRQHGDGGLFSDRFTHNIMSGRPVEFETDGAALLGLCYLLHRDRQLLAPAAAAEYQARVAGSLISEKSEWGCARSQDLFASFSWRLLDGRHSMGLFIPAGGDDMAEWGANNMIGSFTVEGNDLAKRSVRHRDRADGGAFATAGIVRWGQRPGQNEAAIQQRLGFVALPQERLAVLVDLALAAADIRVTEQRALTFHLANDMFNGNRRHLTHAGGSLALAGIGPGGGDRETALRSGWLSVDDRLGIACLGSDALVIHDLTRRQAPFASLGYDLVCWAEAREPRDWRQGETLRDLAFAFIAGTAAETADCSRSLVRIAAAPPSCRALSLRTPAGHGLLLVANLSESDLDVTVEPRPQDGWPWQAPGLTVRDGKCTLALPALSLRWFIVSR